MLMLMFDLENDVDIDRNCFLLIVDADDIDVIKVCWSWGRCLEAKAKQGQPGQGQPGATGGKDKRGGTMVVDRKSLADLLMCGIDSH